MSRDVIGLLVTPQKSAPIPTAAHKDGEKPIRLPNIDPKEAPMKKVGTDLAALVTASKGQCCKEVLQKGEGGNVSRHTKGDHGCTGAVIGLVVNAANGKGQCQYRTATDKGTQVRIGKQFLIEGAGLMQRDTEKDTQQSAKDGKNRK